MIRHRLALVTALGLFGTSACAVDSSPHPGEDRSELRVDFTSAPSAGSCLRITIDGAQRDVRSFDIASRREASFVLGNIPTSTLKVWADAYPAACSQARDGAVTSSFSESASVTVQAGALTHVVLSLTGNQQPSVSVEAEAASQPERVTTPTT